MSRGMVRPKKKASKSLEISHDNSKIIIEEDIGTLEDRKPRCKDGELKEKEVKNG